MAEDDISIDAEAETPASAVEAEAPETESADLGQQEEAVARARGWVPKDQYRGREDDWQDAKSFLDRNSSLQTSVKDLERKLAQKDEEYAERIRRIESANERIMREDRERLIRDLDRAKRSAVELGDVEEYDRIEREEREYFARQIEAERQTAQPQTQRERAPDLMPETQDWIRRNAWFNESENMRQIALGFYGEALEGMPATKDETKRLAYVDKRMSEVYPDKFGSGNRSSSVESGSRMSAQRIVKLTAEERAACSKFIKRGIIKNEAEYIKYLNEYDS